MVVREFGIFERAQGEVLFDFITWLEQKGVLKEDDTLEFILDFSDRFNIPESQQDDLVDLISLSSREKYDEHLETILPFIIFKTEEEKKQFQLMLEANLLDIGKTTPTDLPSNIQATLEKYGNIEALVSDLNILTTTSSLGDIAQAFGYTENSEFIEPMKIQLLTQYGEEHQEKISEINATTTVEQYANDLGGFKPEVALDAMRVDFIRIINAIVG
jgi:hypothetical protein